MINVHSFFVIYYVINLFMYNGMKKSFILVFVIL